MKRSSSSQFALLGMLTLKPMSGYELRQAIAGSIANFWSESYGQIYPALKSLESKGWAAVKADNKNAGRERTVYAITAAGRKALRDWLREPARRQPPRNETLLKIFFAVEAGPGALDGLLRDSLARAEGELARFAAIRKKLTREHAGHPHLPFWLATLSAGEHIQHATADWAAETSKRFQKAGLMPSRRKRARP